ncbi:putative transcriptional regulator [Methanophagales archaeon]|nr:putative transcriptional regulator [Methanophagales archaeon]
MSKSINPRSRWEIILDILDVIEMSENKAKKTRVMKMAYLDWRNFQRHFGFLMENGFVEEIVDPSRGMVYGLTKEGKELRAKLKGLGAVLQ